MRLRLRRAWRDGCDVDLGAVIRGIQQPPFDKVGFLDLESFYPAKERFELAMALNNLIASPGFAAWREGEPLDIGRLLHTEAGKPRLSMATDKKSGTVITLTDHDGKQRMTQAVNAEGMAVITYYHPDGQTQAFQVSTSGEGESSLILYDKTKKNSILASVLADGRSVLALEHDNVTRFRTMIGKGGEPEMGFIEKTKDGLRYTWQAGSK